MAINVTKSFLPPIDEYTKYLAGIWDRHILTNQGPLVLELERRLMHSLDISCLQYCANGTLALQLALSVLDIVGGDVITTPFSYVATTSSILWERCRPVFVDIKHDTFCIDAAKIETVITKDTKAIMAVHVFGYPCDVDLIEAIANRHGLFVIYDGAHAFASRYKNKSLLSYGDVATCSFHATKLFHTVEGGAIILNDVVLNEKLRLIKSFGHDGDEHKMLGINAKNSEFHAAMGLAILPYIEEIIKYRKNASDYYDAHLGGRVGRPVAPAGLDYNYAYYPILFESERQLKFVFAALNKENIFPRRYFFPSLNKLPYLDSASRCPASEDVALRVACLPLFYGIEDRDLALIVKSIQSNL